MIEENVILVDKDDQQIGLMPKLEAHEKRFCIVLFCFVFLTRMKSCCSNVLITILRFFGLIPVAVIKGRSNTDAGRRLLEEMGFKTELKELFILFIRPRLIMV
jgi:isopentenyl-diphosphate delta-isomerase